MATLSGSINSSVTSIVASASTGKQVGDYLVIDNEAMLIEGFGTSAQSTDAIVPVWKDVEDRTKITVKRGQLGTTAASHSSGATIKTSVVPLYGARGGSPIASGGVIAAGATYTATAADDGKTIALDTAAGSVVTLPAATGSGSRLRFVVKTKATSNSHKVQVANGTDVIQGVVSVVDTDTAGTVTGFATGASDDTITLNRSTNGSVTVGEWLELEDIASGVWAVRGAISNTGNGATPFSAAVS